MNQSQGDQPDNRRPKWVVAVLILAAVVPSVVIAMVVIGGGHGPDRHVPSGMGLAAFSSVAAAASDLGRAV